MKLYGSLRELVAAVFRKDTREITLEPNAGTYFGAVNIKLPPVLTGSDVLVSEAGSQSLTNKTIDADLNTVSNIDDGNIKAGAGIDASKIGAGSVDNTEFGYLNGVTSSIQTQLGGKAASGANSDITSLSGLTTVLSTGQGGTGVNSTATFPSSGVVVTEAGSATLTNKTIDGDNNTVQDLGLSSLKTVLADANKAILRDAAGAVTSALIANANISPTAAIDASKIGAGSVDNTEFGYLNGVTSSIQTQLGGKAASGANSDITSLSGLTTALSISQGGTGQTSASAAINALLPSQTTNFNKYLKTDGTNVSWASASGGAGEINAVLNSSGADGVAGWAFDGTHSINTVTGATIPLSPAVPTAFTMSSSAAIAIGSQTSSSGDYYEFTMPPALRNRKLKFEFYYTTPAAADGTWGVAVYNGATKVRLSTDTGATPDTVLPAGVAGGKFTAYFDTDSGTTYRVNFVQRTRTNTNSLWVTNVVVGPGIQPQGAVVGEWVNYTPTITNITIGNGIIAGQYRRVGSSVEIRLDFQSGTTTTYSTSDWKFSLPSGLTRLIPSNAANEAALGVAIGQFNDSNDGESRNGIAVGITTDPTVIYIKDAVTKTNYTGLYWNKTTTGVTDSLSNSRFSVSFSYMVSEWAGSGTVQLAQNDVEYAWNSDPGTTAGTTYSNSTYYGYGPNGTPIVAVNSTTLSESKTLYTVQFQTPVQAGDQVVVELNDGNGWFNSAQRLVGYQNSTASYGVSLIAVNSTTYRVAFGNAGFAANAAYGAAGGAWSGVTSWRWRVRKSSAGAAVGFGIVQPGVSSGLVSASGLPGNTTGNVIAQGYVGEVLTFTAQTTTGALNAIVAASTPLTTLTAGVWLLVPRATFTPSTSITNMKAYCATNNTADFTGAVAYYDLPFNYTATTETCTMPLSVLQMMYVPSGSSQAIYAKSYSGGIARNVTISGFAIRIA